MGGRGNGTQGCVEPGKEGVQERERGGFGELSGGGVGKEGEGFGKVFQVG